MGPQGINLVENFMGVPDLMNPEAPFSSHEKLWPHLGAHQTAASPRANHGKAKQLVWG